MAQYKVIRASLTRAFSPRNVTSLPPTKSSDGVPRFDNLYPLNARDRFSPSDG